MNVVHRILVALLLPKSVPSLIKLAQAIVQAMTNNPHFPNPNPPLATVTAMIMDLAGAETAAMNKTKGAADARNVKLAALVTTLHTLKAHVQEVADATPGQAAAIIQSAGMSAKKPSARAKAPFAAKQGAVSGSVDLAARAAGRRASYEWQYSLDSKTWTSAASTLQAKTTLHGLTPAQSYAFRFRAVTKAGEGDWSQVLTLVVK